MTGPRSPAPALASALAAEPTTAQGTAQGRAALALAALGEIFGLLDGTTLAQASGVCRSWRQAASDDRLWRRLCFEERHDWVGAVPGNPMAPAWAIERSRGPRCPEPPRSWRQAYRLLATVEHGRPFCGSAIPLVVADASIGPPPRWPAADAGRWQSPGEVESLLEPQFGRRPPFERELYGVMRTRRRQVTQLDGTAAIRDATGDVLLAWHERDQPQHWHLPLRPSGRLAGEVRLLARAEGDPVGVGRTHVLTRSGAHWYRWQAGRAAPVAVFLGRVGQLRHVQGRPLWLACDWFQSTYSQLSLFDFATGALLQSYCDNYRQVGATLLTELGPVIGWVDGGWQARILWSSRVDSMSFGSFGARSAQKAREPHRICAGQQGNRPQRLRATALPRHARVIDAALSEDVPGRLLLWWTNNADACSPSTVTSGFVDGWGLAHVAVCPASSAAT